MGLPYTQQMLIGRDLVELTPSDTEFANGISKGLWIGVSGTINITTQDGSDLDGVPVVSGYFPIACKKLRSGGTATDVYAVY